MPNDLFSSSNFPATIYDHLLLYDSVVVVLCIQLVQCMSSLVLFFFVHCNCILTLLSGFEMCMYVSVFTLVRKNGCPPHITYGRKVQ